MQKYKSFRAMTHKMRLRSQYYYGWNNKKRNYTTRDYYSFEKEQCKDLGRTCQSAFFTYNYSDYEGDFEVY